MGCSSLDEGWIQVEEPKWTYVTKTKHHISCVYDYLFQVNQKENLWLQTKLSTGKHLQSK